MMIDGWLGFAIEVLKQPEYSVAIAPLSLPYIHRMRFSMHQENAWICDLYRLALLQKPLRVRNPLSLSIGNPLGLGNRVQIQ